MKNSFLYNEDFSSVSYGKGHPMRPARLGLCRELISALGLDKLPNGVIVPSRAADEEELLLSHSPEYIRILQEADSGSIPAHGGAFGLGYGDNPVFKGVYRWSSLSAGASLQAARMVIEGASERAFNIAGGLHHAMRDRASGFCYINDASLAIEYLVNKGKRVAYVDVDAHHGDGVQEAFYSTDKVLTISLHETGENLFPGTGFVEETGRGRGQGYSINVPLPPGTDDELYLQTFKAVVPHLISAFSPDVLVTQLGADTLASDPLTHLKLTIRGFEEIVSIFCSFNLPWVALGGGGYDIGATASAWAAAWALMNNVKAPEEIPRDFLRQHPGLFTESALRGASPDKGEFFPADAAGRAGEAAGSEYVEKSLRFIREKILPRIQNN